MHRPTRPEMFLMLCHIYSLRSTCIRRMNGAVVTDDLNKVLGVGYNGVRSGRLHCIDDPCPGADGRSGDDLDLCEAIHAEANALMRCNDIHRAKTIYTITYPCVNCMKLISATPIDKLYYCLDYSQNQDRYDSHIGHIEPIKVSWELMKKVYTVTTDERVKSHGFITL